jgi:Flp pilus assembly protein TadD
VHKGADERIGHLAAQASFELALRHAEAQDAEFQARAQLNLGIACERRGKLLRACECYLAALQLVPTSRVALKLCGSVHIALGCVAEAVPYLKSAAAAAVAAGHPMPDAHCDLGMALVRSARSTCRYGLVQPRFC